MAWTGLCKIVCDVLEKSQHVVSFNEEIAARHGQSAGSDV